MKRRSSLAALACGWTSWPAAGASNGARVYRIGYLHPTDPSDVAFPAFVRALKDRGYVDGRNAVLETRFAENHVERLPAMVAELVRIGVDIIVAASPVAIRAARAATRTVPIVMAFSGDDPVQSGFAATLARPGGNTTGLTAMTVDMLPTRMELLIELIPRLEQRPSCGRKDAPITPFTSPFSSASRWHAASGCKPSRCETSWSMRRVWATSPAPETRRSSS